MKPTFVRLMTAADKLKAKTSPSAVARMIGESEQTISNWKHRGVPKAKHLDIARKLGCDPEWFATGTGDMKGGEGRPTKHTLTEPAGLPYAHKNPIIAQIVSMLEATDDIGLGVALMAVSEALSRYRPTKEKAA